MLSTTGGQRPPSPVCSRFRACGFRSRAAGRAAPPASQRRAGGGSASRASRWAASAGHASSSSARARILRRLFEGLAPGARPPRRRRPARRSAQIPSRCGSAPPRSARRADSLAQRRLERRPPGVDAGECSCAFDSSASVARGPLRSRQAAPAPRPRARRRARRRLAARRARHRAAAATSAASSISARSRSRSRPNWSIWRSSSAMRSLARCSSASSA